MSHSERSTCAQGCIPIRTLLFLDKVLPWIVIDRIARASGSSPTLLRMVLLQQWTGLSEEELCQRVRLQKNLRVFLHYAKGEKVPLLATLRTYRETLEQSGILAPLLQGLEDRLTAIEPK